MFQRGGYILVLHLGNVNFQYKKSNDDREDSIAECLDPRSRHFTDPKDSGEPLLETFVVFAKRRSGQCRGRPGAFFRLSRPYEENERPSKDCNANWQERGGLVNVFGCTLGGGRSTVSQCDARSLAMAIPIGWLLDRAKPMMLFLLSPLKRGSHVISLSLNEAYCPIDRGASRHNEQQRNPRST